MEIIKKSIEELKIYKNNPRQNDKAVDFVANSIQDFGFKVPVIIDKNNVIVAGHTRLKAAEKLGLKTVPCVIADDLTEEQIKAFRLVDNKVAELATWNEQRLEEEINSGIEKLERYGFNEYQLEAYKDNPDFSEFFKDDNEPKEPKLYHCPHCGKDFEKEIN